MLWKGESITLFKRLGERERAAQSRPVLQSSRSNGTGVYSVYPHSTLAGTTQKLQAHDRHESNTCNHSVTAKSFYYLCCSVYVLILKTFPNYCKAEGSNLSCQPWVNASNLLNNLTLVMFLIDTYQELNYENNIQTSTGCQKCQSPTITTFLQLHLLCGSAPQKMR